MIATLELIAGLLIVAVVLYDVFQAVVVPRWTDRALRISPLLLDALWPLWRRIGLRIRKAGKREDFLGTFAPLALMLILVAWVLSLILGYGLVAYALRGEFRPPIADLGSGLYVAATSLLTIGYGDIVAHGTPARAAMLAAGASGLAVMALMISLTFTLYDSFQRREVLVLMLDARAGAPPSGVTLLETYAQLGLLAELPALFGAWELWSAEMLDSHLAYPVLPYFRSSHTDESWISALGAVLDAATLLLTTVEAEAPFATERLPVTTLPGAAQLLYALGCHALIDLSHWFRFAPPPRASAEEADQPPSVGVERTEFEEARRRLAAAGFPLCASEVAWRSFAKKRAVYAAALNELAKHFATPPTQWIGDRSPLGNLHHRKARTN